MNDKDLSQLRMKLHHARTLALEVEFAAAKEWGDNSSIATYAGRGIVLLDEAISEIDLEKANQI